MEKENLIYNQESIVSLSAGAAFRSKIGMYLSADRQEAINLGLRELIVNVQDEYEVYKPKNPVLKICLDTQRRIISVEDNMRGIPVGKRKDGINSLTAAFLIPHSGGKHTEGAYSSAIGINGEGNKVVCHTAKWLEVDVRRDGKHYKQRFESNDEGAHAIEEVFESPGNETTGTYIRYQPDPAVYGDCFVDIAALRKMLTEISYFTIGLKIILDVDGVQETFLCKNGLVDGLSHPSPISKPFSYFYETDDCKVELALQWVAKKGEIRGYANGLYMPDGGAFITGFKTSLTKAFNSLADSKFSGEQIRDVLDGFVSVKVKVGQFSNQAKTALANPEARTATATAITNAMKEFATKRSTEFNKVVELLNKVVKAEVAAENARRKVLDTVKEIADTKTKSKLLVGKLKDCKMHGPSSGSVLAICEGDSALGALAQARPIENVALIPILGKIISALKNDTEDILQNEEVKAIFAALGCGFFENYNAKKLRYQYVAIASDSDADGENIACLLITLFYYMCPQLLREGRLLWMRMPLFVLKYSNKTMYAFSDAEKNQLIAKYGKPKELGRKKGIGENTPEETEVAVFGEYKRWEQLVIKDFSSFEETIQMLMGKTVEERKQFIMENVDFSRIGE